MRRVAALAALCLLGAGCSGSDGPRLGVRVDQVRTDIGLGVEVVLDAAPAHIGVTGPVDLPEFIDLPLRTVPPIETPVAVSRECPAAGPFAFPALEGGVDPDPKVRPVPGTYRWKLEGEVFTNQGPVEVDEFETREIKDVVDDSVAPDAFRYTMTQTYFLDSRAGRGTLETTFRVVPSGNFQSVPNPPAGPTVADTGRGAYIVSTVFRGSDSAGQPVERRFEPANPLLILPFPVRDGGEINASGTDLRTGVRVTIRGAISGKKQVDACGERVDTWYIDATETVQFTDPTTLQTQTLEADYDYGIAPQYGSMLLYERVLAPPEEPYVTLEARVGRVPDRSTGAG